MPPPPRSDKANLLPQHLLPSRQTLATRDQLKWIMLNPAVPVLKHVTTEIPLLRTFVHKTIQLKRTGREIAFR